MPCARVREAGDAGARGGPRSGRSRVRGAAGPGVGAPGLAASRRRAGRAPRRSGSLTGSLANGVRRFSRLFSAQVKAEPEAVTTVPKPGLAMTLTQGSGVSCVAVEDDHVLAAVVGEAAEAVGERERRAPRPARVRPRPASLGAARELGAASAARR